MGHLQPMRPALVPDRTSWLWLGAGLLFLLIALSSFHGLRVDDAFISFRYAQNAASGDGLVFNPGERIEGYSNFLWTLLLAIAAKFGVAPDLAAPALGRICLAFGFLVTWRLIHRFQVFARGGWAGLVLALVMASPTLAYWAGAGLETPLFVLLWVSSRERLAAAWQGGSLLPAAALLSLLALCRPDGVLGIATAFVVWGATAVRTERRRWIVACAMVTLGLMAYALWKLAYYGSLLPNTYHAKLLVSDQNLALGASYALAFGLAHPWVLLAMCGLRVRSSSRRFGNPPDGPLQVESRMWSLLTADVVVLGLYGIAIGGDAMPFHRFFAAIVPGLAILALLPVARLAAAGTRGRRRAWQLAAAALVFVGLLVGLTGRSMEKALLAHRVVEIGRVVGSYLAAALPAGSRIAVNAAGAIPYESRLPTVDMLGLVDAHVARSHLAREAGRVRRGHERGDGAYVVAKRPSVVLLGTSAGSFEPVFAADRDLLRQPEFSTLYRPFELSLGKMAERVGLGGERSRRVRRFAVPPWAESRLRRESRTGVLLRYERGTFWGIREIWFVDTAIQLWVRSDLPTPE